MMNRREILIRSSLEADGPYKVDLPVELELFNERFAEIAEWLLEHEIPHQARIVPDPTRIRISFREITHAWAFQGQFGGQLVE